MQYIPRYYQRDAVTSIFDYFKDNKGNPIVAMPTGTGKSLVIADFIVQAVARYPQTRIMMLTHVKELIAQNFEKLLALWPTAPAGIYSSGLKRKDTIYPITYAGVGSVVNNVDSFGKIDLIIVDECHMVSPRQSTMYQKIFDRLKEINPFLKVIGLSATPYRTGVGLLTDGGLFTDFCYDCTDMAGFNKLLDEGYLSPLIPKATNLEFDTSQIRSNSNDFVLKALQEAVDVEELTFAAVKETVEEGYNTNRQKWLIFASGVEHAENVSKTFKAGFDIDAPVVHSKMPEKERDRIILEYKNGKYKAIVNNGILTTGHDFPDLDLISVMRPTKSTSLWVQMLGRGTRPLYAPGYSLETKEWRKYAMSMSSKQNCLVLDFGGNTKRLGPINDPVLPKKKGARKQKGMAPVRLCPECSTYVHASKTECPECGYGFPRGLNIHATADNKDLIVDDTPQVDTFKVSQITCSLHRKQGSPNSIRVCYYCGLRRFTEYVCIEHAGYAGKKARDWWLLRSGMVGVPELPESAEEGVNLFNTLPMPKTINVWHNKKYPEILDYAF